MDTLRMVMMGMTLATVGGGTVAVGSMARTLTVERDGVERTYVCDDVGMVPSPHDGHALCVQVTPRDDTFLAMLCVE
jgi:hypothetical protein